MTQIESSPWDTDGLFEELLEDYEDAIRETEKPDVERTPKGTAVAAAKFGFIDAMPIQDWKANDDAYIESMLKTDLSPQVMQREFGEFGPECPKALFIFEAFGFGTLHGMFRAGQINEAGYQYGGLHLAGFALAHCEEIRDEYVSVIEKLDEEDYA